MDLLFRVFGTYRIICNLINISSGLYLLSISRFFVMIVGLEADLSVCGIVLFFGVVGGSGHLLVLIGLIRSVAP